MTAPMIAPMSPAIPIRPPTEEGFDKLASERGGAAMRLTSTTFLTLDGVVQSPGAPDEDPSGGFEHGGWLVPHADDDMGAIMTNRIAQADGFLLGRRTYEIFSGHWPHVPDDNPIAAALNRLPKYVVSTTLDSVAWANSTLIGEDVVDEVSRLKAKPGRELQVHGSGQLIGTLMSHDLIDEYQLLIYPVAVGRGSRLFGDPAFAAGFALTDSRTTRSGIVVLTYVQAGTPQQGSFALADEPAQHRILR
jgi:dihydrofolate reductase